MFTIIYEKETGNVVSVTSGTPNEPELVNSIPEGDSFIVVDELLHTNPYREKLVVKEGALKVETLVLTPEEEKAAREFELVQQISECHTLLARSDYKAIKFAEGILSEEEYAPIRTQRQSYRDTINALEQELSTIHPREQ